MGPKRQYTAVFAIGAKLLGTFRGAMTAAQGRLRGLQAAASRVGGVIRKLTFAFSGLFAVFGGFLAGKIFQQIFGTATEEAQQAHQRTRSLLVSLRQMDEIRKRGKGAAEDELKRIYAHNAALEKQGVLQKDILDDMAVQLARAKIPSKYIQQTTDKLADLLVATVGVTATQEDGVKMANAFKKAVSSGKVLSLQKQGVDITKEQAKEYSKVVGKVARYQALMKILGDNYKDVNKEARNTPEGRIQLFRNAIKNMASDIGEQLLPAQAELADAWKEALPEVGPLLIAGMKLLLRLVTKLGNMVRTQLIPWWHEFQKTERFEKLKGILKWCEDHFGTILLIVGGIIGALAGLSLLGTIIPIIVAVANPIGLIVIAVLAVVAAIALMYAKWDTIKEMFPATAAVIEHFIEGFKISFVAGWDFVVAIFKSVVAIFTGDWEGVGAAWAKVWTDMGAIADWWKTTLIEVAKAVGQAFKDYFLRVFEDIKGIWTWMKGFSWSGIKSMFSKGKEAATAYGQQMGDTGGFATGGIVTKPQVARVAEDGPEAIIPLNNSARAYALLNQAAGAMGSSLMPGIGAGSGVDAMKGFVVASESFTKGLFEVIHELKPALMKFVTAISPIGGGGPGGAFGGIATAVQAAFGGGGAAGAAAGVAGGAGAPATGVPLSPEGLAKVQAERADIVKDLMRPEMRNLVSATLSTEASSAFGQKNVLEAMVNRAVAYKAAGKYKGMEQMIKGGFYGPYNRGETGAVMRRGLSDARSEQVKSMIEEMSSRNVLHGMTDQGMINEIKGYKENIGGEYFGGMAGLPQQYKTAAYLESHKKAAEAASDAATEPPPYLAKLAAGGIATKPTLAQIGERGPEAVVPLGRGRGAGAPHTSVNFAPNITVNGNMGEEEQAALHARLRSLSREFVSHFKKAQTHERRLSYEGGYG